jgi:hypothetical protein
MDVTGVELASAFNRELIRLFKEAGLQPDALEIMVAAITIIDGYVGQLEEPRRTEVLDDALKFITMIKNGERPDAVSIEEFDLLAAIASMPRYGDPCNNCGACCATSQCIVSVAAFGERPGPCPAFEPKGETKCGMVSNPSRYALSRVICYGEDAVRKATLQLIYAGEGCDARFNVAPRDPAVLERWRKSIAKNRASIASAEKIWGVKNLHQNKR